MQPNIKTRTLYIHDNLPVLRGINSDSIDLIATDPPFNSKRVYEAKKGSLAENQKFSDKWKWEDVDMQSINDYPLIRKLIDTTKAIEGNKIQNSVAAFLAWMAPRLIEMRRILKPTGSIYLHCDPAANSYLRLLMDAVFGRKQFRNEIIWCYRGGGVPKSDFARKHDIILRYSVGSDWIFNVDDIRIPYSKDSLDRLKYKARSFRSSGTYDNYSPNEKGKHPEDWWIMQPIMPSSKERTGWSTQKPLALYERIIKASSNEGDLVLDPFCGCATTCVAAEDLNRKWIGIDIDPIAETITKNRLQEVSALPQLIDENFVNVCTTVPVRTDIENNT